MEEGLEGAGEALTFEPGTSLFPLAASGLPRIRDPEAQGVAARCSEDRCHSSIHQEFLSGKIVRVKLDLFLLSEKRRSTLGIPLLRS